MAFNLLGHFFYLILNFIALLEIIQSIKNFWPIQKERKVALPVFCKQPAKKAATQLSKFVIIKTKRKRKSRSQPVKPLPLCQMRKKWSYE